MNLIELFVELLQHMQSIHSVYQASGVLHDYRHVVSPVVRADEFQILKGIGRYNSEEPPQTFHHTVLSDIQQTQEVGIDLVYQLQVLLASPVSDFV